MPLHAPFQVDRSRRRAGPRRAGRGLLPPGVRDLCRHRQPLPAHPDARRRRPAQRRHVGRADLSRKELRGRGAELLEADQGLLRQAAGDHGVRGGRILRLVRNLQRNRLRDALLQLLHERNERIRRKPEYSRRVGRLAHGTAARGVRPGHGGAGWVRYGVDRRGVEDHHALPHEHMRRQHEKGQERRPGVPLPPRQIRPENLRLQSPRVVS
mmetsp:Transcript_24347/g.43191  ORF Transcript_24347/g.43191 Transcript_24347/m.43191 type:complete len:211 (+) Transcript_24347:1011-1643(+)